MTAAVQPLRTEAQQAHDKEEKWRQLRERVAKAGPLPDLSEVLETKDRSEEEVQDILRRFEAGEFRKQG